MKNYFQLFTLLILSLPVWALNKSHELEARINFKVECELNEKYLKLHFKADCNLDYHHYSAPTVVKYSPSSAKRIKKVRIGEFNVLHPGMGKTRHKDFSILAKIIDQFDIVVATELIPNIADDKKQNDLMLSFLEKAPLEIKKFQERIDLENKKNKPNEDNLKVWAKAISSMQVDLKKASSLYRAPGYLQILKVLNSLDNGKSWSLILTPRGEAAKPTDVQELVGFYYRSDVVKPVPNSYCAELKEFTSKNPVSCIAMMDEQAFGLDKRNVFSRRPFMGSFESGKFKFTLLGSHVVFDGPRGAKEREELLFSAFGKRDLREFPTGFNQANFARFAEVKVTLEFMDILKKKYNINNLIYAADSNLESNNRFWPEVLNSYTGSEVFITEPTTVSESKYNVKKEPTHGVANDYDHFIFNPKELKDCVSPTGEMQAKVLNFYQESFIQNLVEPYIVRVHTESLLELNKRRADQLIKSLNLKDVFGLDRLPRFVITPVVEGKSRVRISKITEVKSDFEKHKNDFKNRVINSQVSLNRYYSIYRELISDHKPIMLECRN